MTWKQLVDRKQPMPPANDIAAWSTVFAMLYLTWPIAIVLLGIGLIPMAAGKCMRRKK